MEGPQQMLAEWPASDAFVDKQAGERVETSDVISYCVSALPAAYVATDDLIIRDTTGRNYLLTPESEVPVPLGRSELDVLGMVYEPAQDTSWHTVEALHRMFFGALES